MGASQRSSARRSLVGVIPQFVASAIVAPVFVVGQHLGFVADHPVVLMLGSLLVATVLTTLAQVVLPHGGSEAIRRSRTRSSGSMC
ncbi:MAG: hypothetical protein ACT4OX_08295 [Actinomycetota bacterium]